MEGKIFFCFNYEKDIKEVESVRNSWFKGYPGEVSGFIDSVSWAELKDKGINSMQKWIDTQLDGSTVTVVLISPETAQLEWVRYAVVESHYRGNGMFGIYMDSVKNSNDDIDEEGMNPFELLTLGGEPMSAKYKTYNWSNEDGGKKFLSWIEKSREGVL